MVESLLSFSNIELFGQIVGDLEIADDRLNVRVASDGNVPALTGHIVINGVQLKRKDKVLVWMQGAAAENSVYRVRGPAQNWVKVDVPVNERVRTGADGTLNKNTVFLRSGATTFVVDTTPEAWNQRRRGRNRQLEEQLPGSSFARIYGFSFEGNYYDLPRPVLFLVHGDGDPVNINEPDTVTAAGQSRPPRPTSLTGLAAADFDFADGLRVWSYDKADYTIRMDVESGMFEQVLLDAMLGGGPGGMDAAGMNARGMNARGMNARGMNARGMNARGMNARGGNSD